MQKITALTFAVTCAITGQAFAESHVDRTGWPDSFTVGTASQGGTFFAYGSGWANLVAEELGVSGGGEVTGGPMQNMALVHTGDVQFGMTTMGPAAESLAGTNPIAPGLQMTNACAMAIKSFCSPTPISKVCRPIPSRTSQMRMTPCP